MRPVCLEPGCHCTFANDKNLGRHTLKFHGNILKDYDHSIPKSFVIRKREERARKKALALLFSASEIGILP
jgi:hypothetical protein